MQRLTKVEENVMQGIWQYGPCTVSQLIEKMGNEKSPHSTISSIVRILESKGFVDHKSYGRTYEYFPIINKKEYSKFSLTRLITNYFEGSVNELVSFMVKEKELSVDELNELIDHLDSKAND